LEAQIEGNGDAEDVVDCRAAAIVRYAGVEDHEPVLLVWNFLVRVIDFEVGGTTPFRLPWDGIIERCPVAVIGMPVDGLAFDLAIGNDAIAIAVAKSSELLLDHSPENMEEIGFG
jgi:hypothetical protein